MAAQETIESTFATVRHRTTITRGPGSRTAQAGDGVQLIQAARVEVIKRMISALRPGGWVIEDSDHVMPLVC